MPVKEACAALILPSFQILMRIREVAEVGTASPYRYLAFLQAVLFTALLLSAAWIDYRKHIIPNILNLGIALSALLCFQPGNISGILAALPFLAAAMGGKMGGGDVKLVAAGGLVLGLWNTLSGCVVGLCLMLFVCLISPGGLQRKEARPMAPFLSAGFLTAYFLL